MRGWIDPMLKEAIDYTGSYAFDPIKIEEVEEVVAIVEGSNDDTCWFWLCRLNTEVEFALIIGWCDYTGFDCQGMIQVYSSSTAEGALEWLESRAVRQNWDGHLDELQPAYDDLWDQIQSGVRTETWREANAKELNLEPVGHLSVVRR